jgi:V8-like Glu-specific endopeptidase
MSKENKERLLAEMYRQEENYQFENLIVGRAESVSGPEAGEHGAHTSVSNRKLDVGAIEVDAPNQGKEPSDLPKKLEVEAIPASGIAELTEAETQLEEGLLLDAWYAEYSDRSTRAMMRYQPARESFLEVVIGADDRVQVTGITRNYPWRAICSLRITANDGSTWIGTGWLVGPRTVITAGHCVYIHSNGGWARRIEVIPGRDGAERPFDSCIATDFRSVTGWTRDRDRSYDYGAIQLLEDCRYGDQLGWFGYGYYGDDRLNRLLVNLSGYPGDKPSGTQWFHSRRIQRVTSTTLVYDIDTAGGQSGAPVWLYEDGSRYVVGIHTNGAMTGNSATRITREVLNNIRDWKADVP